MVCHRLLKLNGYIEQWGYRNKASSGTINFDISFSTTPTFLRCNSSTSTNPLTAAGTGYSQLTNSSVYIVADSGLPSQTWIAIGY